MSKQYAREVSHVGTVTDPLEAFDATLAELRATGDAIQRAIRNAHLGMEQYRETDPAEALDDIHRWLDEMLTDARTVIDLSLEAKSAARTFSDDRRSPKLAVHPPPCTSAR